MNEGHFRCYVPKNFQFESLEMIRQANLIINEYESNGFAITLRQLYYQFVSRALFENVNANYNRLQSIISDARLAGLVSWTAIEDRGRNLMGLTTYENPRAVIDAARSSFRIDKWRSQPFRPEVWVEKQAMEGIIGSISNELQVDFFACKGYNSQSEQWRAGQRFARYIQKGQRPIVIHLGDHDPSGLDMTRDNQERLSMFAGVNVQVLRIALNMDQIERLRPPPNPAKQIDSRFEDYQRLFGDESWELDALNPEMIRDLIRDTVLKFRDESLWDKALMEEAEGKETLDEIIENIDE